MAPHRLSSEPSSTIFPRAFTHTMGVKATLTACSLSPVQAPHLPLLQSHASNDSTVIVKNQPVNYPFPAPITPPTWWTRLPLTRVLLWERRAGCLALVCSPCQPGMFQPLCKILSPFSEWPLFTWRTEHKALWKPVVSQLLYCKWSPGPHCCPVAFTGDDGMFPQHLFSLSCIRKPILWIGFES